MALRDSAEMAALDPFDHRILAALQRDCDQPLDALAEAIGLSRNAIWRRIKAMEASGVIRGRRIDIDPAALGLGLTVFIQIRTNRHSPDWLDRFRAATRDMPEILGAYRMTGDLDYLVRARVPDMAGYDRLYQALIRRVEMSDVSASFVYIM